MSLNFPLIKFLRSDSFFSVLTLLLCTFF